VKKGILLAAFGSASHLGEKALKNFAEDVRARFPDARVRFAFTSDHMRNRMAAAGKKTDSVKKALRRMGFEGYTHVAVQSLHLIPGREYEVLLEEVLEAGRQGGPEHIAVGMPLLQDPEDILLAAEALLSHLPAERKADEAVICVGHGTWHNGAASYEALARVVNLSDRLLFIGTLAGAHGIDTLLPAVRATGAATVWLLPLLSIVGKHAELDMAGTGAASWRSRISQMGITCKPVLKGTVEYTGFAKIWLMHLARALQELPEACR
jgi:sirohydrochlorin cobaltochelatase